MREFGWDIHYVTSLSFPVFLYLTTIIKRIRADNAVDSVFTPYVAAKTGKTAAESLFRSAGTFYLDTVPAESQEEITPELLQLAEDRMDRIIAAREQQLAEAAGISPVPG